MNKQEVINSISKTTGISKEKSKQVLNNILNNITDALAKGEEVKIKDFGVFKRVLRSERKGRNPQTREEFIIPATNVPQFKSAMYLKNKVNKTDVVLGLFNKKKISIEEAEVLNIVFNHSKRMRKNNENDLLIVEVEQIMKDSNLEFKEAERISNQLIDKKILNTMVYYGDTDSVYLRADYRKYL